MNHPVKTDRLAKDLIRFRKPLRKKRKGVVPTLITREAPTRIFFFINTFGLMLLCLFVTPTSATAPQPIQILPVLASEPKAPEHAPKKEAKTTSPASNVKREAVQVSRDSRSKVVRNGKVKVSARDMDLLARLVYAEGRGEPYEGQVAIAAVVLNRVASDEFPNTVREVIYEPNAFSPVHDGNLTNKSDESTRKAVQDAVNGVDPSNGSLYFFNPDTATSKWIYSRPQTVEIGNHRFAR